MRQAAVGREHQFALVDWRMEFITTLHRSESAPPDPQQTNGLFFSNGRFLPIASRSNQKIEESGCLAAARL